MSSSDNQALVVTNFYGLILGHNDYSTSHEFASVAIDVDLSYGDIRTFNCPIDKCTSTAPLHYVGDDCCKSEFYYAPHTEGWLVIEGGEMQLRSDLCTETCKHGLPIPTVAPSVGGVGCGCGEYNLVVRYAYYENGRIGSLSPPSLVGSGTSVSVPSGDDGYCIDGVVTFVGHGGLSNGTTDVGHMGYNGDGANGGSIPISAGIGFPAYSEGYAPPPEGAKWLVRHRSGAYMCASGKKLHISHRSFSHLWDKYHLMFARDIVYVTELKGRVLVFDGEKLFTVNDAKLGFVEDIVDDDVCVTSELQIANRDGLVIWVDKDGVKQASVSNRQGTSAISAGGLLDEELMNLTYMRTLNQNWRIEVFNGRIHFANDDNAYIYDTTKKGQRHALVESSIIPDDYFADCNHLYYLVDGTVKEWNPVDGDECSCPYTYCTTPIVYDDCVNIGGFRALGCSCGDGTNVTFYASSCCVDTEICNCAVDLCNGQHITGCTNLREMKICFTGTDRIARYELSRSLRGVK